MAGGTSACMGVIFAGKYGNAGNAGAAIHGRLPRWRVRPA